MLFKSCSLKKCCKITAVFLTFIIAVKVYEICFKQSLKFQRFVHYDVVDKSTKYILLWTPFFGSHNWKITDKNIKTVTREFLRKKCPADSIKNPNCVITSDPSILHSVEEFDAVVFHGSERRLFFSPTPTRRSVHQKYVMSTLEPISMTKHNFKLDNNFYNWTMTYRLDSNVIWTYNKYIDVNTNKIVGPSHKLNWRKRELFHDDDLISLAQEKTKMAAWFVSHCNAVSGRDKLAKALQKFIKVDIYGKCGNYKCKKTEDCFELIEKKYKFYFSFENELSEDYVTEKLYDYMKINTIPVVFGGANYSSFAPPYSYIDANNFDTVEELAKYLTFLADNPIEYIQYFWWKRYYRFTDYTLGTFCELCDKLHDKAAVSVQDVYVNMENWYNTGYKKPRIKF